MTPRNWLLILALGSGLAVASDPGPQHAAKNTQEVTPVLWHDPGAVEQLDWVGGIGGRARAPKAPFRFVAEDDGGSTPKMNVKDARGVLWAVKWGEEVKAETFASRLAWAAGYFVEPTYFVARGKIRGATGLKRAKNVLGPDGSFTDARFELRGGSMKFLKDKSWEWDSNPFAGTRQLQGLKIIMMLTSNWDNKDARDVERGTNTGIFALSHPGKAQWIYMVTDWGASMGKWGNVIGREKWDCEGYASQTPEFVKNVDDGIVKWGYHGQHTDEAAKGISIPDVRWLLKSVGRISDRQLREGLRASGATPAETACFVPAIRSRINQMKSVARMRPGGSTLISTAGKPAR